MLRLKNITKDYLSGDDKVPALRGVDIEFRKSEFVAILGQSGCGKTTLLNIIGGLDHYTSGDLIIAGRSTKEFGDADWDSYRNHSIGFVFQSYNLIPHQSVLSNVELALTLSGVPKAERKRRAKEALEKVGLGDQLSKKPNQMSGGQMQRVAIARALVNDPEILLADEPTGALDSQTSVQIMEILKEISKDRLIIMVTHNPELAETYATRIVRLLDGKVVGDSMPYESGDEAPALTKKEQKKQHLAKKNAHMSFFTALSLSLNNLMTKKARTFLTSFAGSIGIIGIALILSISTGVNAYINRVQEDTLSSYPITIQAETVDMSSLLTSMAKSRDEGESKHELDAVYQNRVLYELMNTLMTVDTTKNNLTRFKKFIETSDDMAKYLSSVKYTYELPMDIFTTDPDGKIVKSDSAELMRAIMAAYGAPGSAGSGSQSMPFASMGGMDGNTWEEMLPGEDGKLVSDLLGEQYDILYGRWPEKYNEMVLFVSPKNELNDLTLYTLGLISWSELEESMKELSEGEQLDTSVVSWSYEEICGKEFRLLLPTDRYVKGGDGVYTDLAGTESGIDYLWGSADDEAKLKIVGIMRPNDDATASMMSGAVGYTTALTDYIIKSYADSEVIKAQLADKATDVLTGLPFPSDSDVELTDEEKADAVKAYFASLTSADKAAVFTKIASALPDGYVEQYMAGMIGTMTREQIVEMMLEKYAEQMQLDDMSKVEAYLSGMTDEELYGYLTESMRPMIAEQYAAGVAAQLGMMTTDQLAAMLDAAEYTTEQYASFYEEYLPKQVSDSTYEDNLKKLGYVDPDSPSSIMLYASTFEAKDNISALIEEYNENAEEGDEISYTDYVALLMSSVTTIINAISYVLIAFVAISLVVSSIMIGIITYISVLERTKEIGILRAIGASKSDISRVFNAETIIVGFVAGALGIGITLLLTIPINAIIHYLTDIMILNAVLPWRGAIVLVIISILLTFIAGLVPSSIAAKKDPVVALRTE